jgi:HAD superfamily hydrolase (TIGR01509 family)
MDNDRSAPPTAAVIFDLDGVLIDSEPVWESVRRDYVARHHGRWQPDSQERLMGMSTPEWAAYLAGELGVERPPEVVAAEVTELMGERYGERPRLLPGAVAAVRRLAERWPLGVASSSNRELIDLALELLGAADDFVATVSSEEVPRGKPAPDVYLEAARRLDVSPTEAAAIEDSHNGIVSAKAAGMRVLAIPNRRFPPGEDALAQADVVLRSPAELTTEAVSPAD